MIINNVDLIIDFCSWFKHHWCSKNLVEMHICINTLEIEWMYSITFAPRLQRWAINSGPKVPNKLTFRQRKVIKTRKEKSARGRKAVVLPFYIPSLIYIVLAYATALLFKNLQLYFIARRWIGETGRCKNNRKTLSGTRLLRTRWTNRHRLS